jgi:hypothetical protein
LASARFFRGLWSVDLGNSEAVTTPSREQYATGLAGAVLQALAPGENAQLINALDKRERLNSDYQLSEIVPFAARSPHTSRAGIDLRHPFLLQAPVCR